MGRKVKNIWILTTVLIIIYCHYASVIHAEEPTDITKESNTDEPPESEGEKDKIPEPVKEYRLECPSPDGMNGYYVNAPEVKIYHEDQYRTTIYRLMNNGTVRAEGRLDDNSAVILPGEYFSEGVNRLSLHMEDENGAKVEGYDKVQEFLLDTKAPSFEVRAPEGFDKWYAKEARILVITDDTEAGSQTASVSCYCGDKIIGTVTDSKAEFLIRYASERGEGLNIKIIVSDRAGNKTETMKKMYIDNSPPHVTIDGITDYMITSRQIEVQFRTLEDNALDRCVAEVEWEDVNGNRQKIQPPAWVEKEGLSEFSIILSKDGIYHLKLSAMDKAGHSDMEERQIIIDSKSPVIRYVDELNGRYMKKFRWDYPAEAYIWDFTTYNYQIQLDGVLYSDGEEVNVEGQHVIEVQAIDRAGNTATARAWFVVDRTPPEIIFQNVKEAEAYEEEKTFRVVLKNSEDEIQEVQINGVRQSAGKGSKACQFTVREVNDYEVIVKACDQAGNQKVSGILFEIIPKETVLQKVIKPVKKLFVGEKDTKMREKVRGKNRKNKEDLPYIWLLVAVLAGASVSIRLYFRKKKR